MIEFEFEFDVILEELTRRRKTTSYVRYSPLMVTYSVIEMSLEVLSLVYWAG